MDVATPQKSGTADVRTFPRDVYKPGDIQPSSLGNGNLLGFEGREKSSYGTFLASDDSCRSPGYGATSTLAFVSVSYEVPQTFGWIPGMKRTSKTILKPASGLMLPGLNAIMGPTGSGKTTLLDILADRKASSRVKGTVVANGVQRGKNFRFLSGYVVQDDVVTGTLTVRENLHFSAALRLPSHMSHTERKERVDRVIDELGLKNCAEQKATGVVHTPHRGTYIPAIMPQIGTEFIRGVSGGERKRTNIGMELIIEPQVLFLDEPTTGLDSNTAVSVVQLLKRLSCTNNRIVIMSIHQPRYSIFKQFDTLTLLSVGNMVYHGRAEQALNYFHRLGFECEEHDNPADFFLDVIIRSENQNNPHIDSSTPILSNTNNDGNHYQEHGQDLGSLYYHSPECQDVSTKLEPIIDEMNQTKIANGNHRFDCSTDSYSTNVLWQFMVVAWRSGLKMWRNPMTNIIQFFVNTVFALLVGGIFYMRDDTPRGMTDRLGAFFFLTLSQVFSNLGAIELFIKERVAFLHESSSGYYRVSVFFIAKVLTDLIILRALPLGVFCVITYFMIGLQRSVVKFFIFFLTLALTTTASAALAFTFSAMVSVFAVANLLVSLVFILYMLFGGFIISLTSLPHWIQWMKYLSIFRYAIEALAVNEIKDQVYNGTILPNDTCPYHTIQMKYCVAYGNEILAYQGYHTDWIWWDEIALGGTALLWLTLSYIVLRVVKAFYRQHK